LISFTLRKFKDGVVCDVFLCMRHTYCWGDLNNLIGRPSIMGSKIGMLWRKLKKAEEVEQELLKNNSEDMRPSENKVSHECETIRGKVLAIRNRIEDFSKKKKTQERMRVEGRD